MAKKVRSARGAMVDFDLLKIKQQMAAAPTPADVKAREDFVDRRLRRRLKKTPMTYPKAEKSPQTTVDKKMPGTEDLNQQQKFIDPQFDEQDVVSNEENITKQKARPPKENQ